MHDRQQHPSISLTIIRPLLILPACRVFKFRIKSRVLHHGGHLFRRIATDWTEFHAPTRLEDKILEYVMHCNSDAMPILAQSCPIAMNRWTSPRVPTTGMTTFNVVDQDGYISSIGETIEYACGSSLGIKLTGLG
jgi:hypothetical protein